MVSLLLLCDIQLEQKYFTKNDNLAPSTYVDFLSSTYYKEPPILTQESDDDDAFSSKEVTRELPEVTKPRPAIPEFLAKGMCPLTDISYSEILAKRRRFSEQAAIPHARTRWGEAELYRKIVCKSVSKQQCMWQSQLNFSAHHDAQAFLTLYGSSIIPEGLISL